MNRIKLKADASAFEILEKCCFYGVLAITVWAQYGLLIKTVKDFSWVAYLDNDAIYLVERLLRVVKFPGIQEINSFNVDYGSELHLLSPFFIGLKNIFGITDPLFAYQFLTLCHLFFTVAALILIRRMAFEATGLLWVPLAIITATVLLPKFTYYMSFAKPDPNIVLFFILTSIYSLGKYHETSSQKWLIFSVAAAGFTAAVKWWGFFMVGPVLYTLWLHREESSQRKNVGTCLIVSVLGSVAGLIIIYILNPVVVRMAARFTARMFRVYDIVHDVIPSVSSIAASRTDMFFLLFTFLAILLGMGGLLLIRLKGSTLKERLGSPLFEAGYLLLVSFSLIFGFFLWFDFPYLLSDTPNKSMSYYSQYLLLSPQSKNGISSTLYNVSSWLKELYECGVLSIPMCIGLIMGVVICCRPKSWTNFPYRAVILALFIFPFMLFLLLFVGRSAGSIYAMVYPLLLIFIVFSVLGNRGERNENSARLRKITVGFIFLLVSHVSIVNAFGPGLSVPKFYQSRDGLSEIIERLNCDMIQKLQQQKRSEPPWRVFQVQRDFPFDSRNRNIEPVYIPEKDIPDLIGRMDTGDYLLLTENNLLIDGIDGILGQKGVFIIGEITAPKYLRDGRVKKNYRYLLYQKRGVEQRELYQGTVEK